MFTPIRRQDRELSFDEATAILRDGSYGVLAVGGDDGYPYGVPLNYVYLDGAVYFHCARTGHKLDCIRANPRVSFCVVGKADVLPEKFSTAYASAIAFGQAGELPAAENKAVLTAFIEKYSADYREKGMQYVENDHHKPSIIKLQVEHLSGKARKA